MGVVTGRAEGAPLARYQAVRPRALIATEDFALPCWVGRLRRPVERLPDARLVILAEADSELGRLYRRVGFAWVERTVAAVRRPDAAIP